jgi:precorrin-6Y C5,15-methyltransferase (decarboxylating)
MSENKSRWLDIIGVTEAGVEGLSPHAAQLLAQAETVFGPSRFLEALGPSCQQTLVPWRSPFSTMLDQVIANRGKKTLVLASGDPNWFGIGATLSRTIAAEEFAVHVAPSSLQLAAAKMAWPLQNIVTLSVHGRSADLLHPHILPGNRIMALTSNRKTLVEVAQLLKQRSYGCSILRVLENLGGANERITSFVANEYESQIIGDFYVLAIDCVADECAPLLPPVPGLPDNTYAHDGQLTKCLVRGATLAALAPFPAALLWDVGAGSGSIGIEWMRAAKNARAICFEKTQSRIELIARNKCQLGVPDLEIVHGAAPDCLNNQPAPDAIFIGGDVANDAVFETCWKTLKPGGRLVANAVLLDSQAALIKRYKIYGGQLCTIAVSNLDVIGSSPVLRPSLPVTQWVVTKGGA